MHLSNGKKPDISTETSGTIKLEKLEIEYDCKILKNHIMIELSENIFEHMNKNIDNIFVFSKHLINNIILGQVLVYGIGLSYTLETMRTPNGEIIDATIDRIPPITGITNNIKLQNIIGRNGLLRFAIRDINQGLNYREDCPFYFYRSIETLVTVLCGGNDIDKKAWGSFHKMLGTSREDMSVLDKINRGHRHGHHEKFTAEQHIEMLKSVNLFFSKTFKILID